MKTTDLKTEMRARALELGFLDARVAAATVPAAAGLAYGDWLGNGYHGEMSYMERLSDERCAGVDHVLPGARSVIVLAASYFSDVSDIRDDSAGDGHSRGRVRVARYALGRDYHYVLKAKLRALVEWLEQEFPDREWRVVTDSAPILERAFAAAAGIGFIGKNGMIISWMRGSFTLLAEIVTTAEMEPDAPRDGTCGNCTRCLDACPTQAFAGPGVLDARKCISYLTIEKKSELTAEESEATGEWAFGCDICQDVCPYNKSPEESTIEDFAPGTIVNAVESVETFLEPQSNRQFERRFEDSPILRAGKRRVQNLVRSKVED